MPETVRVLVVSDATLVRQGLQSVLGEQAGVAVLGMTEDWPAAVADLDARPPDVLFLDCRLPGLDVAEALAQVEARSPDTRVVAYGALDASCIAAVVAGGGQGYILRTEPPQRMAEAVLAVARGQTWFSQEVVPLIMAGGPGPADAAAALASLSHRQRAILRGVAAGQTNEQIAQELGLALRTVEGHVSRLFDTFGITPRTRVTLALWAKDQGAV